jgi:hypothetical protein
MSRPERSLSALGLGLAYTLAGIALLLQALGAVHVRWTLVAPGILLVCGTVVLLSGILGSRTEHPSSDR